MGFLEWMRRLVRPVPKTPAAPILEDSGLRGDAAETTGEAAPGGPLRVESGEPCGASVWRTNADDGLIREARCVETGGHSEHRLSDGFLWTDGVDERGVMAGIRMDARGIEPHYARRGAARVVWPHPDVAGRVDAAISEARVFHVGAVSFRELCPNGSLSYCVPYMLAPFPVFAVKFESLTSEDFDFQRGLGSSAQVFWDDSIIVDARTPTWIVTGRSHMRSERMGLVELNACVEFDPMTGDVVVLMNKEGSRSACAYDGFGTHAELAFNSDAMSLHSEIVCALTNFLTALQHKKVAVEPESMTRQQRRAAEREGRPSEHFRVRLDPRVTYEKVVREALEGRHVRHPRAHEVRRHFRTLRDGRVTKVREHFRGGKPSRANEYDARRLFPMRREPGELASSGGPG